MARTRCAGRWFFTLTQAVRTPGSGKLVVDTQRGEHDGSESRESERTVNPTRRSNLMREPLVVYFHTNNTSMLELLTKPP